MCWTLSSHAGVCGLLGSSHPCMSSIFSVSNAMPSQSLLPLFFGVGCPVTPSSPFICWLPFRTMLLLPCCIRIVGFRFRVQRGLWASLPVSSCALLHTRVVAMCGWIERGCCLMVYVMAREWLLVCMCWWAPCLCSEPCTRAPLQLCAKVVNSPLAWMRFLCCLPLRRN